MLACLLVIGVRLSASLHYAQVVVAETRATYFVATNSGKLTFILSKIPLNKLI